MAEPCNWILKKFLLFDLIIFVLYFKYFFLISSTIKGILNKHDCQKKSVANILLSEENVQASYAVFILATIYFTDLPCSVKSILKYI